jgi:uncharacterized protein (TIGR02588 family)
MAKRVNRAALKPQSTSPSEWVIGGVGAILVLGAIAYLTFLSIMPKQALPTVSVEVDVPAQQNGETYLVRFAARNLSSSTLAAVRIRGELRTGDRVETSHVNFDYLPAFSARHGGLFFRQDPNRGELQIYATSYREP